MSENTKIQWCDDTHNFWQGCTKVSPGCAHCYAEARDKRFHAASGVTHWGKGAPRVRSKSFDAPLKWNKKPWVCVDCGRPDDRQYDHSCTGRKEDARHTSSVQWHRRRVFSLSLGDWLDDEVPIAWLADMLDVIRRCPNLDFLLLTKRPENWTQRMIEAHRSLAPVAGNLRLSSMLVNWCGWDAPSNIMVGTSVENQEQADKRIPELLKIPARVRFLSVEPLLGQVYLREPLVGATMHDLIDWVIVGGESGPNARPCNVEWIRDIVRQCQSASVPCFVKQMGGFSIEEDGSQRRRILWDDKKGGEMVEWPEDLRVREFPKS